MKVQLADGFATHGRHVPPSSAWFVPDDFPDGIQAALADGSVLDGDSIVVRPGTYVENLDFLGKAIHLKSEQGSEMTVIDGHRNGSVVTFCSGEGPDAVLEGFTLINGSGTPSGQTTRGGGILCDQGSSPTLRNNVIMENTATFGGGICIRGNSSPRIMNHIISGNTARRGGGMQCFGYTATMTGNTICNNTAEMEGGGLRCSSKCDIKIVNTILWNNRAPVGPEIYVGIGDHIFPARLTMSYSDVRGKKASIHIDRGFALHWGPGMMDADPLFVDPDRGDFRLTAESPCKDMGDNSAVTEPTDFEGDPRIKDGTVDLGADER